MSTPTQRQDATPHAHSHPPPVVPLSSLSVSRTSTPPFLTHTSSTPLTKQIAAKIGLPGLQLHEAVEDESEEGTGNLIWTSGVRLSQHLVKNRAGELKGARVLDLGSGTGASGVLVCLCVLCVGVLVWLGGQQCVDTVLVLCVTPEQLLKLLGVSALSLPINLPSHTPTPPNNVNPPLSPHHPQHPTTTTTRHRWHHRSSPGCARDADRHARRAATDIRKRAGQQRTH